MFRDDRDALVGKVDELRTENERLRFENEAMRQELLARRANDPAFGARGAIYKTGYVNEADRAALSHHRLRAFPIESTVLTHLLSLGIVSFIRFNLMHDELPKAEHDDPAASKAIALHLIPYFNFYWVFFNALRLADRLNLQLRLRGEAPSIDRSMVIAVCVISVIPYVNLVLAPFLWLPVAIQMQRAINRIVAIDEERRGTVAAQMRFPEVVAPQTGEAAAQAEREAQAVDEASSAVHAVDHRRAT